MAEKLPDIEEDDEVPAAPAGEEEQLPTEASAPDAEYQWIYDEFQQALGRPPTPEEYANWKEHGSPGQILVELGGGMEVIDADGTEVRVYRDLSAAGDDFTFSYSNKEGEVFAVPEGTAVAGNKNYKKLGTNDGFDIYVNQGEQSGGIVGTIDKALGTDLSGVADKVIPNELKSGIIPIPGISDPTGTTQTALFGKEFNDQGLESLADLTGMKSSDLGQLQTYGRIGAEVALSVMLPGVGPWLAAGVESAFQASQVVGADEDVTKALTNAGIAIAAAYVTSGLQTGSWNPATQIRGGPAVPAGEVPAAGEAPSKAGVPDDLYAYNEPAPAAAPAGTGAPTSSGAGSTTPSTGSGSGGAPGAPQTANMPGSSAPVQTPAAPENVKFQTPGGTPTQPPASVSISDVMSMTPDGMTSTITLWPQGQIQSWTIQPKAIPPPVQNTVTPAWIAAGAGVIGAGLTYLGSMQALSAQEKAMKEAAKLQKEALQKQSEFEQERLNAEMQMYYDRLALEEGADEPHETGSMYTKGTI